MTIYKVLTGLGLLVLGSLSAQAQTSVVRAAERIATERDPKLKEAQRILEPAKTHQETKDSPYLWYVAGLIDHLTANSELNKLKITGSADQQLLYTALLAELPHWLRVDSLEQIPDNKGHRSDKYSKKIRPLLEQDFRLLPNAGDYFLQKKDYRNSSLAFEQYLKISQHPLLRDSKVLTQEEEKRNKIIYYMLTTAYSDKDYKRMTTLGERYKEQPYQQNEIYQLLSASYHELGDSVALERTLRSGQKLFPKQAYYQDNLIALLMEQHRLDEAKTLLQEALKQNPDQFDYITTLGSIFEEQKDWHQAIDYFKRAQSKQPKNLAVNYALGRCYYNLAVSALQQSLSDRLLETKAKEYFRKAVPYLEQAYFGGGKTQEVGKLLSNLYFRLGMEDKTSA